MLIKTERQIKVTLCDQLCKRLQKYPTEQCISMHKNMIILIFETLRVNSWRYRCKNVSNSVRTFGYLLLLWIKFEKSISLASLVILLKDD